MSSLSILVPRLGNDADFQNTLASVLRFRMPKHQVIVVQSDLQVDNFGLENEVEFIEIAGKPSLVRFFNAGIQHTTGSIVNLIRPGVEVSNHWFLHGFRALTAEGIGSAIPVFVQQSSRETILSKGIVAGGRMMPRHVADSRQKPLGPSSWSAFYRRNHLELLYPVDESLHDDFLALDLALSLRTLGLGTKVIEECVMTIRSAKMLRPAVCQKTGRDAQRMIQRHVPRHRQSTAGVWAYAGELASAVMRPSHLVQTFGRWSAKSKRATDRAFSRRIGLARHELAELMSDKAAAKRAA